MLNRVTGLTSRETPNYEVSAAASALLLLSSTVSALEGNIVSFYLTLASSAYLAGVAANQYGLDKTRALASSLAVTAKDSVVGQYHSFFKPKETAATVAPSEDLSEKPAPRAKRSS
jgi:hypothetical protein